MSKWPGCPTVACINDLCSTECQRLKVQPHTIDGLSIADRLRRWFHATDEPIALFMQAADELDRLTVLAAQQDVREAADEIAWRDKEITRLRNESSALASALVEVRRPLEILAASGEMLADDALDFLNKAQPQT